MQQQFVRWFRVILGVGPLVTVCVWVGASALPSRAAKDEGGLLCAAASAVARTSSAAAALLQRVAVSPSAPVETVPGMPPVLDRSNLYSAAGAGRLSAAVAGEPTRIYVPNRRSNDVYVIDPETLVVIDRYRVGCRLA